MRQITIVALVVISTAVFTYGYTVNDKSSTQTLAVNSQNSSTSSSSSDLELKKKIDKLANEMVAYYASSSENMQQMQLEQTRLSETLLVLNDRLDDMNISGDQSDKNETLGKHKEKIEELDVDNGVDVNTKSAIISAGDFGQWIDKTIDLGDFDANLSALTSEQALLTVSELSNVNLDDVRCSEKVCRAALSRNPGEDAPIHELFGRPPFNNEGFTVEKEDGRVLVYFTQPGVSIDELRAESQQTPF